MLTIQPTVIQASVVRSEASLERWGENLDVVWANDGRGLILLVSPCCSTTTAQQNPELTATDLDLSSAILSTPDHFAIRLRSPTDQCLPPRRRSRRRRCPSRMGAPSLRIRIRHGRLYESTSPTSQLTRHSPSSAIYPVCTLPYTESLALPARKPLSSTSVGWGWGRSGRMRSVGYVESERLDGIPWYGRISVVDCRLISDQPPIPSRVSISRTAGLPNLYTLEVKDERVYAMYPGSQVQHIRPSVRLVTCGLS
jgi:hypothetical protein